MVMYTLLLRPLYISLAVAALTEGADLRGVLPLGQRAREGLSSKVVPEPALVLQLRFRGLAVAVVACSGRHGLLGYEGLQ
jgi:hypothetical protein